MQAFGLFAHVDLSRHAALLFLCAAGQRGKVMAVFGGERRQVVFPGGELVARR